MNIIENVFSEQFIYALGWTLIHSLWQGAFIGLLIAVAMVLLHKYSAKLRYFIYSISLLVVAGLAVVTFISSYATFQSSDVKSNLPASTSGVFFNSGETTMSISGPAKESGRMKTFLISTATYCRTHIPLFVTIWLLGMLAFMLRFLGGYALVRRYKHHRTKPVRGEWEQRFARLAQRSGITQKVRLLESALIKLPMVIGYLKPVVLLPLGAISGVPAEQMEAILAHELAHIRRRDYLVNLIQSLLEVIFFYHPVVWWLSKNIRVERENICDDIAITLTGNTMEFAKALTNIQEINLTAPSLATGLSGKNKNRLLNRIRRIAGKPRLHSNFAEGFIASIILLISLIGLSAAAMITYPVDKPAEMTLSFEETSDALPGFSYFTNKNSIPDTTDKKEQEVKEAKPERLIIYYPDTNELSEEELEDIREIEAIVEAELEAVEAKLEAVEAELEVELQHLKAMEIYEDALQDVYFDREKHMAEIGKAMEEYQHAMKEMQFNYNAAAHWTLPRMYFNADSNIFYSGDSSVWRSFEYSDSIYHLYSDSLYEFYYQNWEEQFPDMKELDVLFDRDNELMLMEEKLIALEGLYEELEVLYEKMPTESQFLAFEPVHIPHRPVFGVSDQVRRIVTDELHEDDLIEYGREYMVLIDKKQMLINGEKQPRSVFKKYRRLIDSMDDPWKLDDDEAFRMHIGR